jgi:RNA polymerase sigma-70 factor (ECF subfamily)
MNHDGEAKLERLLPYYGRIVTFFTALGFSREEARDLTQDVFLRVCKSVDEYRGDAAWAYLERTARNLARNAIRDRHAKKRDAIMESDDVLTGLSDERITPPDGELERREAADWLHRAVDRLDDNQRPPMRLYLAGLSYEEIASSLGLTVSAVKSRLNLARKRLKEMLEGDER